MRYLPRFVAGERGYNSILLIAYCLYLWYLIFGATAVSYWIILQRLVDAFTGGVLLCRHTLLSVQGYSLTHPSRRTGKTSSLLIVLSVNCLPGVYLLLREVLSCFSPTQQ